MYLGNVRHLVAQAKAKQVLREVHELPVNFPPFTADLDDRVTFVAYALHQLMAAEVRVHDLNLPKLKWFTAKGAR